MCAQWVMHLRRAGYLFSQIGEAFFVHYPHKNRIAEVDDEADYAGEADDPETDASEAYHGTDNPKPKPAIAPITQTMATQISTPSLPGSSCKILK